MSRKGRKNLVIEGGFIIRVEEEKRRLKTLGGGTWVGSKCMPERTLSRKRVMSTTFCERGKSLLEEEKEREEKPKRGGRRSGKNRGCGREVVAGESSHLSVAHVRR